MEGREEEKHGLLLRCLGERQMQLLKTFRFKPMRNYSRYCQVQAKATNKSHFNKPRV